MERRIMAYKYSNSVTKKIGILSSCGSSIRDIEDVLKDEGCDVLPSPFCTKSIDVIDGDELESIDAKNTSRGSKNKSVDVVFGVEDDGDSLLQSYVFVELKFRTKTFTTLDKDSLKEKVKCSSKLCGVGKDLYQFQYLVFSKNKVNWARHYLFRTNPILNSTFKAISISKLYDQFFI
ncbi:hypothetical protein [Olleya marilimosa]|uniref:Uncharacterized protein n=1 Tax=Olleya marilimosa TaxID=272164 RepID=A0ABR8LU91_9FLAO|nr:hypothetical protein [Olleya marilimosa]MBD3863261.1 hypothetical protein [Olleya marilimosa]